MSGLTGQSTAQLVNRAVNRTISAAKRPTEQLCNTCWDLTLQFAIAKILVAPQEAGPRLQSEPGRPSTALHKLPRLGRALRTRMALSGPEGPLGRESSSGPNRPCRARGGSHSLSRLCTAIGQRSTEGLLYSHCIHFTTCNPLFVGDPSRKNHQTQMSTLLGSFALPSPRSCSETKRRVW